MYHASTLCVSGPVARWACRCSWYRWWLCCSSRLEVSTIVGEEQLDGLLEVVIAKLEILRSHSRCGGCHHGELSYFTVIHDDVLSKSVSSEIDDSNVYCFVGQI